MQAYGNIQLKDKGYRIDIASFRSRDLTDFSPRSTTPGGSIIHNELALYQPYWMESFNHGFGFQWHTDAMGYLSTNGMIDTRQPGIVTMYTNPVESDTDNDDKYGFVTFNNIEYSYGPGGLRKYSGGSWSDVGGLGDINYAFATATYLFLCMDGTRIQKMNTSETVSAAGLDANATDFSWLIAYNGYFYAGKDGTAYVHYDDNEDLSQLQGDSSDTNRILVGAGNYSIGTPIVYNTKLYIPRADGLWVLGEDLIPRRVLDFRDQIDPTNFRSLAVHNGYLIFTIRDTIFQWNGSRLSDITPPKLTDHYPYTTYGRFDNLVVVGPYLYMTARSNESTYVESLLCWDGVGWHKMNDLVSNGTDTISAMGYDTVNEYLWYHLNATADKTYYIAHQQRSVFASSPFPTTGTHELITSRIGMGFRRVTKSMASLLVGASNLSANTYIEIYYQLDEETTWHLWNAVKTDGITELLNPGAQKTREFKYIKLKVKFITSSSTQTPVLELLTIRFIMRPEVLYGHAFSVPLAGGMMEGDHIEPRTTSEILDDLEEARDSKAPILLVDPWGRNHYGYISALSTNIVEQHAGDPEDEDFEARADVNFVEVQHDATA